MYNNHMLGQLHITLGDLRSVFGFKARRQIRELYLFLLLFSFASSLITIFEPIFFYSQGFKLWLIAIYYLTHYVVYVVALPWGAKLAARFGYERSLAVSTPILVVYFLILSGVTEFWQLFWLGPFVLAAHKIFFWPAYHATFAAYSNSDNRGTEQSWQRIIVYGVGIIGPLLGGFIVVWFGFAALFIVAAVTLVLAGLPLLTTKENQQRREMSYSAGWQVIRQRANRRMVLAASAGWMENLVYMVFWPIYMFIILRSAELLGLVVSLSVAVMVLWGFFVGELADRKTPRVVLRWAAPFIAASYILRILSHSVAMILPADILARVSDTSMEVPTMSRLYAKARRVGSLRYMLAFEISLACGKVVMAAALAAVFFFLPMQTAFVVTFALAGVMALFYRAL
ncbi:MAG: MFS transporter [bacterium]|nr:MFS transporter [bacterium]